MSIFYLILNKKRPFQALKSKRYRYTDTDMGDVNERREKLEKAIPLGRINDSEDVANSVWFLCSSMARNITGEILTIDGGLGLH